MIRMELSKKDPKSFLQIFQCIFSIEITKAHFNFLFPIGRGGFGKVWRVESKKVKGETFAMKEMCKARVMAKKSVPSVMNELKLLS